MGDWKRGESKQMTPWEGKGQVPKKRAYGTGCIKLKVCP